MTITTLHVIPFIAVFHTKCMHTIFSSEIIWLIFGPSCKVSFSSINPSKVAFYGSIIQAQPRFGAIMSMLQIHILFIAADINKDRVFLSTFVHRCGPVCTIYTCKVAVAIKVAPTRITNVWEANKYLIISNLLLTEREGRTGEYWPEIVAVRTERSEVRTKTTAGQYSPYGSS